MLPIGPLMIEHRLIERMIVLLAKEAARMEAEKNINVLFLDAAVDFILIYGDRLHHAKEEDILFRELNRKAMSPEHRRLMEELVEEHRRGRRAVADLAEAKELYLSGNKNSLSAIVQHAKFLAQMYPRHIDKEDHHFFLPCMQYFSPEEKDLMLGREYEFDRNIIHQIYKEKVVREEASTDINEL